MKQNQDKEKNGKIKVIKKVVIGQKATQRDSSRSKQSGELGKKSQGQRITKKAKKKLKLLIEEQMNQTPRFKANQFSDDDFARDNDALISFDALDKVEEEAKHRPNLLISQTNGQF